MSPDELRAEFIWLLTTDSESKDARRSDFNQVIFLPPGACHAAVGLSTAAEFRPMIPPFLDAPSAAPRGHLDSGEHRLSRSDRLDRHGPQNLASRARKPTAAGLSACPPGGDQTRASG